MIWSQTQTRIQKTNPSQNVARYFYFFMQASGQTTIGNDDTHEEESFSPSFVCKDITPPIISDWQGLRPPTVIVRPKSRFHWYEYPTEKPNLGGKKPFDCVQRARGLWGETVILVLQR